MKKRFGSIALASALGFGGLATGIVVAPTLANAATSESPAPTTESQAPEGNAAPTAADRTARIKDALAGLVSDGTLTQAQADKVAGTLADKLPAGGRGHGPGGPGGPRLDAAATALGVPADELRTALEGGKSLADVAAEKGIAKEKLIADLVKAAETRLSEQVSAGRLTQAQADERKAGLTERVTSLVDRKGLPSRGERPSRD
jgi:hypothetical protein